MIKKRIENKKIKRFIQTILILFTILVLFVLSVNIFIWHSTNDNILNPENIVSEDYDCILVLGCGLRSDGSPSSMLEDRLKRAVELYKAGVAPKILMTGDHGTIEYDEVNTMKDYAVRHGIPEEVIFTDHAGFSTYESIYRADFIFKVKKAIIVTQEYHLPRALYISKKFGLDCVGVSSDYRKYYGQNYRELREVAARTKDFIICIFKPEPTFLGDIIPVSGDAKASHDK